MKPRASKRTLLLLASSVPAEAGCGSSGFLQELLANVLPEALKIPDGAVTATNQIEIATDEFYDLNSWSSTTDGIISHVVATNYNEWTENDLLTRGSSVTLSCLCLDFRCTEAVAADLQGVLNPSKGAFRQTSPLILKSTNGTLLPCLWLQEPILTIDEDDVTGCELIPGRGPTGEIIVQNCDSNGAIESFQLPFARPLTPVEVTVANVLPGFLPTVSILDLFTNGQDLDPLIRSMLAAVIDSLLEAIWPTDFDESRPGSEAGQHELMRILFKFAFYRYRQSSHKDYTRQKTHLLESVGLYSTLTNKRPPEVSLSEIINNIVVLIASGAAWMWAMGRLVLSFRAGQWPDRGLQAAAVGGTITLLGALLVFVLQWKDMVERITYSGSLIIIEVMFFSRTGNLFFGRVGKDKDLLSLSITSVGVSDVSPDYTWLFVLGALLTATGMAVAFAVAKEQDEGAQEDEHDDGTKVMPTRLKLMVFLIWAFVIILVPIVLGVVEKDRLPNSTTILLNREHGLPAGSSCNNSSVMPLMQAETLMPTPSPVKSGTEDEGSPTSPPGRNPTLVCPCQIQSGLFRCTVRARGSNLFTGIYRGVDWNTMLGVCDDCTCINGEFAACLQASNTDGTKRVCCYETYSQLYNEDMCN